MEETALKLLGCKVEREKRKARVERKEKREKKRKKYTSTKSVRNFLLIYIYLLSEFNIVECCFFFFVYVPPK